MYVGNATMTYIVKRRKYCLVGVLFVMTMFLQSTKALSHRALEHLQEVLNIG